MHSDRQDDYEANHTYQSQQDYPFYLSTQNYKYNDRFHNDYSCPQVDNSLQEEDSKDEDSSYQGSQTQPSNFDSYPLKTTKENFLNAQIMKQYHTQNLNRQLLQNPSLIDKSRDHKVISAFSNSFDESAPSLDLRPQRNCKSSTRMQSKNQKRQGGNPQLPIPMIQNIQNEMVTAGSLNRKQAAFNNYMRSKQQIQGSYQQTILNQLQRANTQNSFDMKTNGQDLSNRSMVLTPGGQNLMNSSFALNQYLYGTQQNLNKPITPHTASGSGGNNIYQSVILSAGGGTMNPRNGQVNQNQSTMDPYTYLKWKQQKYKSCRSIQASNGQIQKQYANYMNNSQMIVQQRKGNQTQKNNKSTCSSTGSAFGTSTTTMTVPISSLADVKNPQYFISFRFNDRKVTQLSGISNFKNLSELDVSGNMLTEEVVELKQLQFLKKLNLSNNSIQELYSLPQNLEILNVSYNTLKRLKGEVTSQLKNLTTLDVSNNGLETLDGIQNMKRLKRLLSKNNQIIELEPLAEIETLIELDLENNPVDSYQKFISMLSNKKDILVVNLKLSPIMLTIQNYEQLVTEIESSVTDLSTNIDIFKKKLKFFTTGCLYRSKRAYHKLRSLQQHSKRSSSNFSNGSSSCGRAGGANTGGRTTGLNININNSMGNAFSPLLNNMLSTPNQGQKTSQRLEDIEQIYDEILDEEEEHERKLNKIQRRKLKKKNGFDDESEDEDESLYEEEDEDDIHPTMSFEEEMDELHSYRNHHNNPNEFLNESTADFNKEIRQINQELREQFGNELGVGTPEQLQSLQSTSTNQTRKNPISFKLDLSKCRQQQSEEEDDNIDAGNDDQDPDGHLEIPGLQFVKVTDDSFRQFQKQQSLQQSIRNQMSKRQETSSNNTLRDYPPKQQQKQVFIPKLQLGILQQNNQCNLSIPMKQQQQHMSFLQTSASKKSVQQSAKSLRLDTVSQDTSQIISKQPTPQKPSSSEECCTNHKCCKLLEDFQSLKSQYEEESKLHQEELSSYRGVVDQIKDITSFNGDFQNLPALIKEEFAKLNQLKQDLDCMQSNFEDHMIKYQNLLSAKSLDETNRQLSLQNEYQIRCLEKEKTISDLQVQLRMMEKSQSYNQKDDHEYLMPESQLSAYDIKRTQSSQIEKTFSQNLLSNPSYFYSNNVQSHVNNEQDELLLDSQVECLNTRTKKKKLMCDFRKIKRPQSVAATGQRRSTQAIKINNILRIDPSTGNHNLDETSYVNEYCSNAEVEEPAGGNRQNLSQTMNRKVGHYLQRLKERNSSLQERLNGSFCGSGTNSALKRASPLNLTAQNHDISNNPYILSPSNHHNELVFKPMHPQSATSHSSMNLNISSFTNTAIKQPNHKHRPLPRKMTQQDSNLQTNDYSQRVKISKVQYDPSSGQPPKQHSKTQRISVNKIQYNQFFQQSAVARQALNNSGGVCEEEFDSTRQSRRDGAMSNGVNGYGTYMQNR